MRWSKIKNIIILLLVIVNGFLLALVVLQWESDPLSCGLSSCCSHLQSN